MNNLSSSTNLSLIIATEDEVTGPVITLIQASTLIIGAAFIAFFVNLYLLVCSTFLRRPLTVNLQLCLSLTTSDCAGAFFYILSNLVNITLPYLLNTKEIISNCFTLVIEAFKIATFFASVFNLLVLALNHYIGIVYPLNRHAITSKTVKFAILVAYLFPIMGMMTLFSVMPGLGFQAEKAFGFFSPNGCEGSKIFNEVLVRWIIVAPFVVFVIIISFLYLHILLHMHKLSQDPILNQPGTNVSKRQNNKRLLVTIMLLAGSAILGWLPTLSQYVLFCNACPIKLPRQTYFYLMVVAMLLNVMKFIADAFIYASRLIEIRYAIWMFNMTILSNFPCCRNMKFDMPQTFNKYLSETKERRSVASSKRVILERIREAGRSSRTPYTRTVRTNYIPEQQRLL
ncbi:G protein-coupled receptor, rhodopsin-like family and GPCR, rhodopsin-like, 7TM domain-containing protein [Strongyloides ratti]|uniref:G protein-coupled receptor, rhodopsin-like family and GPCR, rhodopsin-like, 7TM domain-containing protein n=1 Tax=Strongyloides ratti TaxID=34506 RepID=A0A090MP15_STRRB|nr:G protein-coupled receptor, rhodopsin-like family and GPCR, rhodopsin-like, 7TM domain-containing protein [Strongyloides ratti]CEF59826.1 G protein-coupled receptor, rhodopsin-like family and GPCR, rhodopsin-like, 7TM domain-containing protein [Strongyloides ratti]